jgi:hypothetical protein
MHPIDGWLDDAEADVLIGGLARALDELPAPHTIVEVGCHCGKATVVLAGVVRALAADAHVHAIDSHDGRVGSRDHGLQECGPTLERFRRSIAQAGVADLVSAEVQHSWQTSLHRQVSFLLIDGLHDYAAVSGDFAHFEPLLVDGGYVAFHDYASYFPGVRRLVDELLASGHYTRAALAESMVLLRRLPVAERRARRRASAPKRTPAPTAPLVSCVMATYARPHLVPVAVAALLRQTHPAVELIVVDDGPDSLGPLLPSDDRVRHLRLDQRQSIGAKRNLGCEAAGGEVLANWDDDDWYAPWRIAYQLEQLTSGAADVCGLDRLLYFDPVGSRAWRYAWPSSARPWLHDAVLLFTRDFWRRNPFPDTSMGIDCRMLWTPTSKHVLPLADERFYVGMVHPTNTSPKNTATGLWTRCGVDEVEALMGDDVAVYRTALTADPLAPAAGDA